jgi:SAM-dependent methyltransferase
MNQSQGSTVPSTFDDGELYDIVCGELDYGSDFYLALARSAKGPVLELACGTGRIMLPCLKAGVDIEGLDLYESMLKRLVEKANAQKLDARVHRADMSDFRLSRQFALVMIPFNAFIHNMTSDAQIRCLRLCREHLLPGGLLAFDTFFPGKEYIMVPDGTRVLEGESKHPVTGLPMRFFDTRSFHRVEQIQHSYNELELLDAAGNVTAVYPSATSARWIYKSEMNLLLRLANFDRWEICGDFDRRPLVNETDAMIVLAWKSEGNR